MRLWRGLIISLMVALGGCAGPRYWHEAPRPGVAGELEGRWEGLVRNGSMQYRTAFGLMPRVQVRCAVYRDLLRLQVAGERVEGTLGRQGQVRFSALLDAEGRFSVALPVEGDTWVWGGVPLWGDRSPLLLIGGQLDGQSGIGEGWLNLSPQEPRLGCSGHFEVSRNGGPPPEDAYGAPFEIRYWIDEAQRWHHPYPWVRPWPRW